MSINTVTSSTNSVSTTNSKSELSSSELSKRFTDLLVAQLRNQDPLNPTDGQAMTAQLAQMQSVSQLEKISDLLEAQSKNSSVTSNLSEAAQSIGKDIQAKLSDTGEISSGVLSLSYDFGNSKPFLSKLTATGSNGAILQSWDLSEPKGDIVFSQPFPDGTKFSISSVYSNGLPDSTHSGSSFLTQNINVKEVRLLNNQAYVSNGSQTLIPWNQVISLSNPE